jgi:hypothetical protein
MFGETAPMIDTLVYAAITIDWGPWMLAFFMTLVVSIPLAWVIGSTWESVTKLRLNAGLKQQMIALQQQMIERGMTADEIVRIVGPPSKAPDDLSAEEDDEAEDDEAGVVNGPYPGEVVYEREGEWHSALVLRRNGDRYLIHTCPGYNSAVLSGDNIEWVKSDRLRFPVPASPRGQDGSSLGPADRTGAFDADQWCGQPKKEPVPAEL